MLSDADREYAHDVIASAIDWARWERYPADLATEDARDTLEAAGFSPEEIKEALETFEE